MTKRSSYLPAAVLGLIFLLGFGAYFFVNNSVSQTTSTMTTTSSTNVSTSSSTSISTTSTATPIKHIVFLIQENHTFCNMYCTYPGVPSNEGYSSTVCMARPNGLPCQKLFNADSNSSIQNSIDICHTSTCAHTSFDSGKMDGFGIAQSAAKSNLPMAYYDSGAVPYYWNYAQYFTLNDLFMSSALSFSLPNHLYTVAAQAGITAKCSGLCQTPYNLTFPDIGNALSHAGVPWAYYQYSWNDNLDCNGVNNWTAQYVNSQVSGGYDGFWSGEAEFSTVQQNQQTCYNLLNYHDLQTAISSNSLPAVSWIIPAPQVSEHPQQSSWLQGEQYTSSIINSIEKSAMWSSTVIYLTWDDYGGYYDPVVPTQIDQYGMGFRVPLLAISPYSIQGAIVHGPTYNYAGGSTNQEDFSSMLSTIEYNWHIPPLTVRDAEQPNLFYMLNFHQTPLAPLYQGTSNVVYPYSTCVSNGACSTTTPMAFTINVPSGPVLSEPLSAALANSGDGDPGD